MWGVRRVFKGVVLLCLRGVRTWLAKSGCIILILGSPLPLGQLPFLLLDFFTILLCRATSWSMISRKIPFLHWSNVCQSYILMSAIICCPIRPCLHLCNRLFNYVIALGACPEKEYWSKTHVSYESCKCVTIPDICHGRHGHAHVNFFWPV